MEENELDEWFTHLKITEQEHIATKLYAKEQKDEGLIPDGTKVTYPESTKVWMRQTDITKDWIYNHRTYHHGTTIIDWQEGKSFSY